MKEQVPYPGPDQLLKRMEDVGLPWAEKGEELTKEDKKAFRSL
jgi:hypothetical protein